MSHTLTFWGTRGSIPTPGPATARYGGNTPCIAISGTNGGLVVLDAGTGLRPLGHELMLRRNGRPLTAEILLSHTHWDHIQGLPFFKPLSAPGNRVRIYGAAQEGVALAEILGRQMDPMVFPVPLDAVAADLSVNEVSEGGFELEHFHVRTIRLRHPGQTLGYRLQPLDGGREIGYITDNELGPGGAYEVGENWRARLVDFLQGCDTVIHDAMYAEGMIRARAGWGHSTPGEAVRLTAEAGCSRLVLFHHEPEHDDDAMDDLLCETRVLARTIAPGLEVDAAMEGSQIRL
ncbi:MAG: MBL fold metallo-hydrolase [Gemmatimonadales bacterium]|nr:MBL fold metallo-hydrolase [Gemmatimonadales bacterium]